MLQNIGLPGLLLIAVVVLVLFGKGKVSSLMGEVGKGITAFKKGVSDGQAEIEQAKAERRAFTRAATYAKRFAAKEAFSKAVGTGFRNGVFMRDIGVVNLPSGAPALTLTGGARARLDALTPPGHAVEVHLTLTDDHPWAQAFVVIEAVPESPA